MKGGSQPTADAERPRVSCSRGHQCELAGEPRIHLSGHTRDAAAVPKAPAVGVRPDQPGRSPPIRWATSTEVPGADTRQLVTG